ncbi:MAG: hypothetical protein M0Z82_11685 [Actinomycetota bacterium]|nr:hypothetical protein [Actinomycetota bacterium]
MAPVLRGAVAPAKRTRVVLEIADPPEARAVAAMLEDDGNDVMWCQGPAAPASCCPLAARGECILVECCDVVVFGLGLDDPRCREVLEALEHHHPTTPVVVATCEPPDARWAPLLAGRRVVLLARRAKDLRDAVREAAGSSAKRGPTGGGAGT